MHFNKMFLRQNKRRSVFVRIAIPFIILILGLLISLPVNAVTRLTVYTALEAEELEPLRQAFRAENPDVDINWVRDSTGIITGKMLAEIDAGNPQADVFLGTSATSLLVVDSKGWLLPYSPKGLEKLDAKFRDKRNPPHWVGVDAYAAVVCYNTVEAKKHNLPKPSSWQDLLKPVYRNHLVMPNPNSSGTGFLDVSSWLQIYGERGGWQYMDNLHENIAWYTHSGSKPCKQAARGETPIGISFAFRGAKSKAAGAPLDIILPKEGVGWDMEATAIVKGTKKLSAAQTLVDWSITKKANKLYNQGYAVVAYPGIAKPVKHFPEGILDAMIDNDFQFAAVNRKKILAEWQKRYDAKSEAK